MHHYVLLVTDSKEHDRLNTQLTGPLTAGRVPMITPSGMTPPSWWHGDAHATRSSLAAQVELRHR